MTLAVMALYADSPTMLTGTTAGAQNDWYRYAGLSSCKVGAQAEEGPDWIRKAPGCRAPAQRAAITTYDDYRMAMRLSLAASPTARRWRWAASWTWVRRW